MVPSSSWAGNWGTAVGLAGAKWSAGFIAAGPSIFTKGAAAVGTWQSAVQSPTAAANYVKGLNAVNFSTVTTTVNGTGQGKYTSSGSVKQAKYAAFATIFAPKLSSIVAALPPRAARGSPANRTRLNQYLDQVAATRGMN